MEAGDHRVSEREALSSSPLGVNDPSFVALGLLTGPPTGLNRAFHRRGSATLLRPSCRNDPYWCRIINLLPITYAFRPRLRGRLTLGRLTLPRNPWAFGDRVSHPVYRYSSLHKLFQALQPSLPSTFAALGMLAYQWEHPKMFATPRLRYNALAPLHFRRRLS